MKIRNRRTMEARGLTGRNIKAVSEKKERLSAHWCTHCEVYVPSADLISRGSGFYEHRGPADGGKGCGQTFLSDGPENNTD